MFSKGLLETRLSDKEMVKYAHIATYCFLIQPFIAGGSSASVCAPCPVGTYSGSTGGAYLEDMYSPFR